MPEAELEKYGFILFFALFLVFNLIYWPWLLISSGYYDWVVDLKHNPKDEH
jgi:hypothetical protein